MITPDRNQATSFLWKIGAFGKDDGMQNAILTFGVVITVFKMELSFKKCIHI
jgi:hypothetical protein